MSHDKTQSLRSAGWEHEALPHEMFRFLIEAIPDAVGGRSGVATLGKVKSRTARKQRADQFGGTGVGLAITQRVRIWAQAEPERGAPFYFTFGTERAYQPPKIDV